MSCGCKNKPQSQPAPSTTPAPNTPGPRQVTNNNIQESIKKVVEKYYKKK